MPRLGSIAVLLAILAASAGFVAVAEATLWRNLRSGTVTVQNGSLPPPYGRAHVYRFTTPKAVAKLTNALNANHIAPRRRTGTGGCVGGFNLTLKLVGRSTQTLSAYECGSHNYGAIAGSVGRLLSSLGISTP